MPTVWLILGWVVWAVTALFALFNILSSLRPDREGWRKKDHIMKALLFSGAAAVTVFGGVSKLHLFWVDPAVMLLGTAVLAGRMTFATAQNQTRPGGTRETFDACRLRFEQAQEAIRPLSVRALNRLTVFKARYEVEHWKMSAEDYSKVLAGMDDPADRGHYTEVELETHCSAMEILATSFDAFSAAFLALNCAEPDEANEFEITARACFNVYCETFKSDIEAFTHAAALAGIAAKHLKVDAADRSARAWMFDCVPVEAEESAKLAGAAKAASARAEAAEHSAMAERLERRASAAEAMSSALRSKAEWAEAASV